MLIRRVLEHGGRGTFFLYRCHHNGHHRADFEIQDTQSLPIGFEVLRKTALKLNARAEEA